MGPRSPYCLPLPVKTPKPQQPPPSWPGPSTSKVPLAKLRTKHPENVPFPRSLGSEKGPATKTPTAAGSSESILEDKGSSPRSPPDSSSKSTEDNNIPLATQPEGPPSGQVAPVKESLSWKFVRTGFKRNRSIDNLKSLVILQSIDVEYKNLTFRHGRSLECDTTLCRPGSRHLPTSVAVSKEATHFLKKYHTRIAKDERPTRVGEMVDFFLEDIQTATLPTAMNKLLREDIQVSKAERFVWSTCNGDTLVKFASMHPVALHGVLHSSMRSNAAHLADVVQVHVINRVLAASEPSSDTSFINKWSKRIGGKVRTKRQDSFASVTHWWSDSPAMDDLQRATQSLAFSS
uniref:AlNc14C60G4405 protein n=1 Tax=Albugo laibachii Nc14 TaxID=890382 RepID=F0WCM1_9STRA|nr:AlNc14C60G4405 [Albugo laibachii Nc14]|eukprot:CCA18942.1 AlNc14C60G4405 [Albugo laibachii Nc14]